MTRMLPGYVAVSRSLRHALPILLLAGAAFASQASATTYRIVELPLPAEMSGAAIGINAAGEVVGYIRDDNYRRAAVAWDATSHSWRMLPAGSAVESEAYAINDAGDIVGSAQFRGSGQLQDPVLWTPNGTMIRLGELPGGQSNSWAYDINSRGRAVGGVERPRGDLPPDAYHLQRPAIWITPRMVRWLGDGRRGFGGGQARALNDSDTVVGFGSVADGVLHGFRWTPGGSVQDLGDLPGGSDWSYAYDINEVGQVVGTGESEVGSRAVMWDGDGTIHDLGEVSGGSDYGYHADDINNPGEVTGRIHDYADDGFPQGFVWYAGAGMMRIADLIDPLDPLHAKVASGDVRIYINDINDAGLMVGGMAIGASSSSTPIVLEPQP